MFLSWARQKPAVLSNHLNQPSLRRLLVYETQSKPGNHHITQSGRRRFVQGLAAGGVGSRRVYHYWLCVRTAWPGINNI